MLAWVAGNLFEGRGNICELGSFMGGSTVYLAYGLQQRRRSRVMARVQAMIGHLTGFKPLHCFDGFYVPAEAKQALLDYWGFPSFEGPDFLSVFEQNTAEFTSLIAVHKGDINVAKWQAPIEILFVDCCKDWSTNDSVAHIFYPHLIPNVSIVIQQDYLHFQHPWVVATMEALYPRVRAIARTEENSMIFACYDRITRRDIESATSMRGDLARVKELIRRAQSRFEDPGAKRYLEQHVIALDQNPDAEFSWDLRL